MRLTNFLLKNLKERTLVSQFFLVVDSVLLYGCLELEVQIYMPYQD